MSADWDWRPLGDLFDIGAGKTMSAAARAGGDKVPFLRTSNVLWDRIDLTELDEMAIPPAELERKRLAAGDLLVCEGGEIGRAALWNGVIDLISFQNHLHRLRPKLADVVPRFYVYFLQSAFTQLGIFAGAGNKTTIPNLSANRLAALEVPHPPEEEQREVARALSLVRLAMELNEELLTLSQQLKRAAMEQVFRRGLGEAGQADSPIGPVPRGWVVEELGEGHTVQTGATPSRRNPRYWDGGTIPWVKTGEVSYRTISETSEHITEAALAETTIKAFPSGTLLLAMYGQGATRGKVARLGIQATCNQACAAIQPSTDRVNSDYLYYFLEWQYDGIRRRAHGGQQQNLNLEIVRMIPLVYPEDLHEQREVVSLLAAVDDKLNLHRIRSELFREFFGRLLRDLMSGEVSVDEFNFPHLVETSKSSSLSGFAT